MLQGNGIFFSAALVLLSCAIAQSQQLTPMDHAEGLNVQNGTSTEWHAVCPKGMYPITGSCHSNNTSTVALTEVGGFQLEDGTWGWVCKWASPVGGVVNSWCIPNPLPK